MIKVTRPYDFFDEQKRGIEESPKAAQERAISARQETLNYALIQAENLLADETKLNELSMWLDIARKSLAEIADSLQKELPQLFLLYKSRYDSISAQRKKTVTPFITATVEYYFGKPDEISDYYSEDPSVQNDLLKRLLRVQTELSHVGCSHTEISRALRPYSSLILNTPTEKISSLEEE